MGNDKEGTSEFSVDSVCNGCGEEARVNDNHLCADCINFPDGRPVDEVITEPSESLHERNAARFFQQELPPIVLNGDVVRHLGELGKSLSVLEVKLLRRSVAMETMRKMMADPTKYSIYDLFQEAWGGGYHLNLNFTEREEWK